MNAFSEKNQDYEGFVFITAETPFLQNTIKKQSFVLY